MKHLLILTLLLPAGCMQSWKVKDLSRWEARLLIEENNKALREEMTRSLDYLNDKTVPTSRSL